MPAGISYSSGDTLELLELRKFVAPEFVFGLGAAELSGRYCANLGLNHVLLVTDAGVCATGMVDELRAILQKAEISSEVFDQVSPNPRDHEVMKGAKAFVDSGADGILALGGGSPMDCAKGIGVVVSNGGHILDYTGVDRVPVPSPPLLCLPTTSGTAAELSQFAIISNTRTLVKEAIISKTVIPDAALIDPALTNSMDEYLTACTGLDALTHAIEAWSSNARSHITCENALVAIELVGSSLRQALEHPQSEEWRARMLLASVYAGLAFSNASLGLVHSMAHALGGLLDLPHGECNALLLEHVLEFNRLAIGDRADALKARVSWLGEGQGDSMDKAIHCIRQLRKDVGVDRSLSELEDDHLGKLASAALADPCLVTNPRNPQFEDVVGIYEQLR